MVFPSSLSRRRVLFLPIFLLALSAAAATVPAVQSAKVSSPVHLDGQIDEWTSVPRISDAKTGSEFAFQNDGRYLYVLLVVKNPEFLKSAEATGMTVLGSPGGSRKPARGVRFLNGEISADGHIVWLESQGAVLSEAEKAEIRKTPRHPIFLAFAVDEKGSSYGPLRKQTETLPPDFAANRQADAAVFECRIPLATPDLVPGGLGGTPGATIRLTFDWAATTQKSLSTQGSRESPGHNPGYQSGTGRTWGQEFLDTFDPLSRPDLAAKRFSFAVEVKLADER
ncbi:MAG: hypothetical protein NTX99_03180 [Candidatus Aminicenantes bacterium]|nr:hypothetical protein [Candidatus Aminicenantes bacterium]